jgi:hypothetical protein
MWRILIVTAPFVTANVQVVTEGTATVNLIETNAFKNLVHLSLTFTFASDAEIKVRHTLFADQSGANAPTF